MDHKSHIRRVLLITALGGASLGVAPLAAAAVPVEESVGASRGASQSASQSASQPAGGGAIDSRDLGDGGADTGRLTQLFYQLQVLQQEVQELRGMVEEQNHQLQRLARDQQEQYLDLDRRMQGLRGGSGGAAGSTGRGASGAGAGLNAGEGPARGQSPSGAVGVGANGSVSERDAYSRAFELMKQRQFDASVDAFEQMIVDYPNGAYTPNAFYWLGELHLALDRNEQARQAFAQVINLYPDHQKVPDALYKLGVVYHRLGDVDRAREYLTQVRNQHPRSSAAGLAQTYLAEL